MFTVETSGGAEVTIDLSGLGEDTETLDLLVSDMMINQGVDLFDALALLGIDVEDDGEQH